MGACKSADKGPGSRKEEHGAARDGEKSSMSTMERFEQRAGGLGGGGSEPPWRRVDEDGQ